LEWKFREGTTREDGLEEDPNQIAHFSHPGCASGGFTKVDELIRTGGKGGAVIYVWVDDLEVAEKVS
jgi:predicted enzyme related to lactoylglutathione lyase